jgi:hypothetical protein
MRFEARKSMAIAAGLAAALAVVPMAAPAASASDGDQLKQRMVKACQRVPHAIERTQKLQHRLGADATTRGSLAWLAAQQQKAAANGHADRAQMLASRLEFRQELAGILPDRLTWLQQAQAICAKKAANPSNPTSDGTSS